MGHVLGLRFYADQFIEKVNRNIVPLFNSNSNSEMF
jgi:hypothetical protein